MLYILGLILSKEKFLFCNGYFVCLKDFLFQYIEHRVCTNVCEYVYVPKHRCYIFESLDQKPVYFHTLGTFDDIILCIVARHLQYIVMIVKWRLQIYNKTNIRDLFLVSSPSLTLSLDDICNYFKKGIEVTLEFTRSSHNKIYTWVVWNI